MASRLRLSKECSTKLQFLSGRLEIRRNLVARLAIGYSLSKKEKPSIKQKDNQGYEFNRSTLTGKHDLIFKLLISEYEDRYIPDEEYFPILLRAHIENGVKLLYDKYQKINSPVDFLIKLAEKNTINV